MNTGRPSLSIVPLALLVCTTRAAGAQRPQDEGRPTLHAQPIESTMEVRLDGLLDEPAWDHATPVSGFRQREPDEGAPASEPTEVQVLYDRGYLYIGVRAYDSQPERIVARQLERDAPVGASRFGSGGDDAIELILDTFHDRRNAYYFATNPRGIQVDGLITDESESPDTNWDGVWDVRARITPDGWSAEFAIPLRTLRFPHRRGGMTWGFNVQRVVVRKTEQSLWTSWSRDNEGLHRVSRAGELTGLESLPRQLNLYIKPYVLGETGQDYAAPADGDLEFDGDIGVDAKLGLASGLTLDLTVNTDFAQVEADDEQIDLTRFTLFFPEKREFFLENAGIFTFGSEQFFGPPDLLLFFSRRIGLQRTGFAQAQTVPILGGARFTGRAGGQTIGLINVTTANDESLGAPVSNFAVGRIKRDIGERSYIGAIVTHRHEEAGVDNVAGGVDWNLWLSNPLVVEGFYSATYDSRPGGDDQAWSLVLDYTGDWFGWRAEHLEIGPEMEPGMGFIRRRDIARSDAGVRFTPRPPIPGLRKIDIFNRFEYVADADSRGLLDREWSLSVSPQLDSGDEGRFELVYRFQRLADSFELTPGVTVPTGDFEDWTFEGSLETSESRLLAAGVNGGAGGFWDGDRWFLGASLDFNTPHFGLGFNYDHNDIDVPGGAFTTDLVRARIKLAWNTRLFGNALIQYNSQTEDFSVNFRVDFIHRPGSDLFIVFNERRSVDRDWDPQSRAFIVKLTYLKWF